MGQRAESTGHGDRRSKLIGKRNCNQSKTRLGRSRVLLLFSSDGFKKSWIFSFSGFPPVPSLGQALRGNDNKTINIE
jgi:hypothetical protein